MAGIEKQPQVGRCRQKTLGLLDCLDKRINVCVMKALDTVIPTESDYLIE